MRPREPPDRHTSLCAVENSQQVCCQTRTCSEKAWIYVSSLSLSLSLAIFARASFSFFICVSRGDCFTLRAFCTRGPFSGSRDAQRTELHRTASGKKPGLMSMSAIPVMFCKLRDDLRRAVAFGSHLTFSQYATVRWSIGEIGISHNLSLISDRYKCERMIFVLLSSHGS